ncbi:MAG: damage-inducible protein DinB [Alphaproteobacteria bacterium]|nr:damage-inducible protein DinB [Alphaproteobacteria bacterium]
MATYNMAMNKRLYDAAGRLADAVRREPRGAFWSSIHGTFNHLLWADQIWMSRFDAWEAPKIVQKDSAGLIADFSELRRAREEADAKILNWARRVDVAWLAKDQTWYSATLKGEITQPRGPLIVHFFNHQTHHRGQAHALITAAGEKTGDTDIFLIPEVVAAATSP